MSMMSSLSLKIKTTSGITIETIADPDLTIHDLKAICCEELQTPPCNQTFLFRGTVCNDNDTLESIKITNNSTLIVLLKKEEKKEEKVNDNNNNMISMQQSLMKEMLNNPSIQEMFSRRFQSSPAMQKLLDKHPELRHAMKDPALMKQMMRAATDPNYRKEMMQNQDRMLRNIESMPGGFNALSRMYNQVQNPMQSAMDDIYRKKFGKSATKITQIDKSKGPIKEPIQNPWNKQPHTINGNRNGNDMMNMFNMMRMMNGNQNTDPRRLYVNELRELRNMGFCNEQKNIDALIATRGDVNAAIQYILSTEDQQ